MFRCFGERNSALGNAFLFVNVVEREGCESGRFVSDSSSDCLSFLCLERGKQRLILTSQDPDLEEGKDLIVGFSARNLAKDSFYLNLKHFGRYLKVEMISNKEIKLHFDCGFATSFSKGYSEIVKNEDLCEDFILKSISNSAKVACLKCKDCLFRGRQQESLEFQKLPKEGWKDLIECWSCHRNEFSGFSERQPHYLSKCLYIGVDSVIFGADSLQNERCACGQCKEKHPIEVCNLEFHDFQGKISLIPPIKFLFLRIIANSWTHSTFKYVVRSQGKDGQNALLFWIISFVTECCFGEEQTFRRSLKVLWKRTAFSLVNLKEYEILSHVLSIDDFQCIENELERENARLPASLQKSLENFNLYFLSLEDD